MRLVIALTSIVKNSCRRHQSVWFVKDEIIQRWDRRVQIDMKMLWGLCVSMNFSLPSAPLPSLLRTDIVYQAFGARR